MRDHLVAVDIGTASARAAIFNRSGELIAKETRPIRMHAPTSLHAEHDSEDIWNAVCTSVKAALRQAALAPERIAAVGFDATCSLVFRGFNDSALSISVSGEQRLDTISWMDHRALREAEALSALGGAPVERAGGLLSPEMALPKLLWVKQNLPEVWNRTSAIFDLADYMTFRATGRRTRSVSTLVSKWGCVGKACNWPPLFLGRADLEDLPSRAGLDAGHAVPGTAIGYLSPAGALAMGLDEGCRVAPGMIDAYAGALGLLGRYAGHAPSLSSRAALIAGTSSCLIGFVGAENGGYRSLWGPFRDVSLPGHRLVEGGQSAAGALLDHFVRMHPKGGEPDGALHARIIDHIGKGLGREGLDYGRPLQVLPDFHGNRAPHADPWATGVIAGLNLDITFDGLCRLYWRTAVGLACGLREIVETFAKARIVPEVLHLGGGHARNPLLVQLYADMTGKPVFVPARKESILLGSAINAATAADLYPSVQDAAEAMTDEGGVIKPDAARRPSFDRDYERHLMMIRHRAELMAV